MLTRICIKLAGSSLNQTPPISSSPPLTKYQTSNHAFSQSPKNKMAPHQALQLKNGNGRVFTLDRSAAKHSALIRMLLQDFDEDNLHDSVIPLAINDVSDAALGKVFEWMHHQKDEAKDAVDDDNSDVCGRLEGMKIAASTVSQDVSEGKSNSNPANTNPKPRRKNCVKFTKSDLSFFSTTMTSRMLYEILIAANYLEVKPLYDMACQVVADMIRGKTTEEIREIYGVRNDFTVEEETVKAGFGWGLRGV